MTDIADIENAETNPVVLGPWALVWRKFRRHRLAMVSLWVVIFIYLVAIFGEFLTVMPIEKTSTRNTFQPPQGIHLFVTVDTFNNVNRFFGRKALSEFEMRVLFQMSANDSAALADTPQASTLGMHRALLYNDQQGTLETFRPYALPDRGWIDEVGKSLGVAG